MPDSQYKRDTAEKRLITTTAKLRVAEKYEEYDAVFDDWLREDIIEVMEDDEHKQLCCYLSHRPVFKPESKMTSVRPVFDVSC